MSFPSFFQSPKKGDKGNYENPKIVFYGIENQNKKNWVKWSTICKLEELVGLSIKDIQNFNVALLAKWKWKYAIENT